MLVKYTVDSLDTANISHSVTLVPRLKYSLNLLDEIISILDSKRNELRQSNENLVHDFDEFDKTHISAFHLEYLVVFSLDILSQVKNRTNLISNVGSIPELLPSTIPMIRMVSSQLFGIMPNCSQKLSEMSVHLGSIVLDSAALTTARFDFSLSNTESSILINEVKLMVNSKLSKQYPNLDFFKLCNT